MLKQLIQWLLDSRTTPAQAAHSALRNTSSSTSIFTGEQIYTAPEDGFITVEGKSEANGGSAIGISSNGESYFLRTFQSVKDWGQAVTAPVSKGETVSISLYNLTDIEVKFYKSFGGGYKALKKLILQGGGLCLKVWYSSLQRNSWLVKDRGFNTQLVRPRMQRPSALQPMANGINLHPAGTVMSHTLETPQALFWKSPMVAQVSLILNRLQDGILFLCQKVKSLGISFQQIQQCRICTLSPCGMQTNSAVGGASC